MDGGRAVVVDREYRIVVIPNFSKVVPGVRFSLLAPMAESSHEHMIEKVILRHFGQKPGFIRRMKTGICNEVYLVGLGDKEVIARLKDQEKWLLGSQYYIPIFKKLGIAVTDILAEDYSKSVIPYAYQIQSKIDGQDLGDVIETLTDEQLQALAKEIVSIVNKVKTIPSSEQFGPVWGEQNDFRDTWSERMKIWIEDSEKHGRKTGVMDDAMFDLAQRLYESYASYFDSVKPVTYYGDMCSKNVMIHNGAFIGLVDLDGLTQGDFLEPIGRIKLSWYGTRHGKIYSDSVMDELELTNEQRNIVTVYSLLNAIAWACENGIKFNENTTGVVDKEKEARDKKRIQMLASELGLR